MKFSSIKINNFRQYYGVTDINLTTDPDKNIVLIGGRNGYGKTNLLISLVWCLYGEKISQVDDHFKKEIQKDKNYAQFLWQSLNWDAQKENTNCFSVELVISDLNIPPIHPFEGGISSVVINREYNRITGEGTLTILEKVTRLPLFEDEHDCIAFINDFIIPYNAAKFVFFDAEEIGAIAELSTKEEGNFFNDALGKILGLDIYEDLIEDLTIFSQSLSRDSASGNIQDQILNREETINREQRSIANLEEKNAEILGDIEFIKNNIRNYDSFINQHSRGPQSPINREKYLTLKADLDVRIAESEERFNDLSEIIPLVILAGKIEEVNEQISLQEKKQGLLIAERENRQLIDSFIEKLFNAPPEPINSSLSFKDKVFYYEKAQSLAGELFTSESEDIELNFELDLNNTEKELLNSTYEYVSVQSKELFETTIDNYNRLKLESAEVNRLLNKIDADLEDEIIVEYLTSKEKAERKLAENNQLLGSNNEKIKKSRTNIVRLTQECQTLLEKVEISQKNKLKLRKTKEYVSVLQTFVDQQKELKKDSLAKSILEELQKLMHKLRDDSSQFVTDVKVTILAEGGGMKVTLYNSDDVEIKKEVLSQGEKQLYISSLIKAILKESSQSLPIFIDTPLGRLDDEHIKNSLLYFYPELSEQVVILSTNNEITPRRFSDISHHVARTYLLSNEGGNTVVKNDYFKNS